MKTKDIKAKAQDFLKNNPDVSKVFATSDGQLFLTHNSANLHATTNPKKKKLTIEEFENSETTKAEKSNGEASKSTPPSKPKNARKVIAAVKVETDKAKLDEIEKSENALAKPRTSVIEAIGKRRAELASTGADKVDAARKTDDNTEEE